VKAHPLPLLPVERRNRGCSTRSKSSSAPPCWRSSSSSRSRSSRPVADATGPRRVTSNSVRPTANGTEAICLVPKMASRPPRSLISKTRTSSPPLLRGSRAPRC
jgi:hypothetical protein